MSTTACRRVTGQLSPGDVQYINTASFAKAVSDYANHIRTFEQIAQNVDNSLGTLLDSWQGEGRDSFRMEMSQIGRCMCDIHESMDTLKKTLDAAAAAYAEADRGVAGAFRG